MYRVRGRSRRDALLFAALVAGYVVLYRRFVFGLEFAFHDTLWDHHAFYAILAQWVKGGYAVGWNPYLSGGEPLYVFSNFFLWAELLVFVLLNKLFALPVHLLINVYFTYVLVSFCTFCFVLFSVVFPGRLTAFYGLIPLLFGGLTISTFGQYMLSPLYLLPPSLLAAYLFVTERRVIYLFWAAFFVGVSANHYLPHYLVISVGVFLLCGACAEHRGSGARRGPPERGTLWRALGIALLCAAVVAPAVFVYQEVRDRISPTRGNLALTSQGAGFQPGVHLAPSQYEFLVRVPQSNPERSEWSALAYNHSVFFIGWVPLLLAVGSLALARDRRYLWFLASLGVVALVALGDGFVLWRWLKTSVPFFFLRHAYPLAITVTLLIVILSAFGFDRLRVPTGAKVLLCGLTLALSLAGTWRAHHADKRYRTPFELAPLTDPVERRFYSRLLSPVPLDTEPVIAKRASATHPLEDFVLFRARPYHELLLRDLGAVTGRLFLFSESLEFRELSLEGVRNEVAEGSFERWAEARAAFDFGGSGTGASIEENRDRRWVLDGSASARVRLRPGARARIGYRHPRPEETRGRFSAFGFCMASPAGRQVSVNLTIAQGGQPAPIPVPGSRPLVETDGTLLMIHTYARRGEWECVRRTFHVRPDAQQLALSLILYAEGDVDAYLDRLELKIVPREPQPGMVELPVEVVGAADPNRVVIRADFPGDGYLIRKENYHEGWSARVDGAPVPIERYGGVFQAVPVRRGVHAVEFTFRSAYGWLMWLHVASVLVGYAGFWSRVARMGRDTDRAGGER